VTWDNVLSLAKKLGKSAKTKAQLIEIAYMVKAAGGVRSAMFSETVGQVVNEYFDKLNNLVYNAWSRVAGGLTDAATMQTALRTEHKRLIKELGTQAYYEGMREAGIATPETDMDEGDKADLSVWITGQLEHVNDFAIAVIAAARDVEKRAQILQRVGWWTDGIRTIGGMGYMNSKRNMPGTWRMNFVRVTKEHCTTCAMLNGKRHRLKWFLSNGYIPRQRGSNTLACRGYMCGCGIVDDMGGLIL
jgi:hypothetical protein